MVRASMSFDDYDNLVDRLTDNSFKCGDWWPTVEEIQENIEPYFNKNIEFLIWILETATPPRNEEEKRSKKYINNLLIKNLKMTD
jgi:hypothetical protein